LIFFITIYLKILNIITKQALFQIAYAKLN
jgi:hypothetical protein